MAIDLDDYGWRGGEPPGDGTLGRIVRVDRGECDVATAAGMARALSDSQRAQAEVAPATGDWVLLGEDPELGTLVRQVLPRSNTLSRRDPSEAGLEQVLVANVDDVLIVHGLDRPLPAGRLERLLVVAWDSGADVAVALTKADTRAGGSADEVVATVRAVAPGTEVLLVGGDEGIDRVRARTGPGRTVALLGESGAGKSTLVNRLLGEDRLTTGEVRGGDAKGRHTTVSRELVHLPGGGLVIDTPGIRAVGLLDTEEALDRVFGDLQDLSAGCRYADCVHDSEPDCAVTGAVAAGDVEERRVARYRALRDELAEQRRRDEERRRRGGRGRR
ncbi:MAG: ribosome small subunit-dependent GTPase A [Acidimicrobiales bacterium]|nr:ribosome small subunit-dependent GTPase A [Acidimicrobiales bacterium]